MIEQTVINESRRRLPRWLKRPLPAGEPFATTKRIVARSGVATVCQDAKCPNLTECWSRRTATFMILGHRCTRRCRFCAVQTGRPFPPEPDEPERLGAASAELGLRHVVITAVARDDLNDQGASHFAACIEAVRRHNPAATVEVLPSDFRGRRECIKRVCDVGPDVYNHNIETVERLTPIVRPQARYRRSIGVIRTVGASAPHVLAKSGLMVGLGETREELTRTFGDLVDAGCRMLTIGQYLQPSPDHAPVEKFYHPDEFEALTDEARSLGFSSVASGPFVRSSYDAGAVFAETRRRAAPVG
ncbi:MAG: lipoyl synthase [Phycisphaerales bacterium]|nr:MAG: lipoyl synthase [Phycisphaerales bacterium]